MTTEDDFQRQLDECPEDFQTRLVFADWLEEQGDARAEGYRALAVLRKHPVKSEDGKSGLWFRWRQTKERRHRQYARHATLPQDWMELLPECTEKQYGGDFWPGGPMMVALVSTREAEDAAALAFAKLPAQRRAELLNPTSEAVRS